MLLNLTTEKSYPTGDISGKLDEKEIVHAIQLVQLDI